MVESLLAHIASDKAIFGNKNLIKISITFIKLKG